MVKVSGGDQHYTDGRGSGRLDGGRTRSGQPVRDDAPQIKGLPRDMDNTWLLGQLKANKNNAGKVIREARDTLAKLPPGKRAKAERWIKSTAHKNRQGRGDGGTPYLDSR
jgi:hypothetical protein